MIYIIGDGGHARVVAELIETLGHEWRMVSRDNEIDFLAEGSNGKMIAIGIGMQKHKIDICPSLMRRYSVAAKFAANGFGVPPLMHKGSIFTLSVKLGKACQVMAGAIVQCRTQLGDACIINTGAQVDHDCTIGMGAHIAPGAVICGGCSIGNCTLIGANATVLPGVSVGNHVVVGAAQVVRKDIQ